MGIIKKKDRTPPWPPCPSWSTSKWWSFLRSKLRSGFTRWPPKFEVLADARRKYVGPKKQQKWEFQCNVCKSWVMQKEIEVDHLIPCGSLKSFEDLPGFVERLYCSKEHLQAICKPCHKLKNKEERSKK